MKKTKKALASLAIAGMVLSMAPASIFAATADSNRIAGADRYQTSIKIAEKAYSTATTAVIAAGNPNNLVDALAAAPLAAQEKAPIYLTDKADMNDDVKASLAKLGVKKVIVVGAAASQAVVDELKAAGLEVEEVKGAGRVETAEAINAKLTAPAGTIVVGYNGVADAMSVASYAAANGYKIVVAKADGTTTAMDVDYVVGGPTLVKDIAGAERLYGADRYETNKKVIETLTFDYGTVYVANGATLADALVASVLAGQSKAPIALSDGKTVKAADVINPELTSKSVVIALGGTGVVSDAALAKVGYGIDEDAEFGVKSVSAANLIQVKVELTNDNYLDKDELEDVTNYDFEGDDATDSSDSITGIDVLEAEVDGTTVTLTLENAVENQSKGSLIIDEEVTGEELEFNDIKFMDTEIPTITDVQVIGKDTVKFSFSEPIADLANMEDEFEFELDGKNHSVKKVVPVNHGFEANVTVYGDFSEGDLTVDVGNGLEDYAGFNVIAQSFDVDVVEDTQAPEVVGYKSAKANEVTLIFNEDIQLESTDVDDFYHTSSKNPVSSINASQIDGNELTLDFTDNELPDGTAYVFIESGSVSDLWDNENNSIRVQVETEFDSIDPTVKDVEYDNGVITVTFSEAMDSSTAKDTDNYTLVDPDGDTVSISDATLLSGSKKVELELRDSDPDEGTYELTIADVEDVAGNEVAEVTKDVIIDDSQAPVHPDAAYYDLSGSKYRIYLEYDEEMAVDGSYSVADLYKYELTNGTTTINLGKVNADDDYDVRLDVIDNGKTVRITSDYPFTDADSNGTLDQTIKVVGRVADVEGNYSTLSESLVLPITAKSAQSIDITKAQAKSSTSIEVDFASNIDSYDEGDFIVWADGSGTGSADGLYEANKETRYLVNDITVKDADTATFEIDEDTKLPANTEGMKVLLGTIASPETENAYGISLKGSIGIATAGKTVVDKIAPNVKKDDDVNKSVAYGTAGTDDGVARVYATYNTGSSTSDITIVFNEPVDTAKLDKSLFIVKKGGTSTKFTVDRVTPSGDEKSVVLTVSGGEVSGKVAKGDTIDIAMVYDKAPAANYTSSLQLKVEYPVTNYVAPVQSNDTTLESNNAEVVTVNNTTHKLYVADATTAAALVAALDTVSAAADFELQDTAGDPVDDATAVDATMQVVVTAEDGSTQTYAIVLD